MLRPLLALILVALSSPSTFAAASLNLGLDVPGDADIRTVVYGCGEGTDPLTVQYVNAEPNFLAIIPVEGRNRTFVNVVTASGAKYVSGQYEWWDKGADATLHDVTEGLDAAPVLTCSQNVQTP